MPDCNDFAAQCQHNLYLPDRILLQRLVDALQFLQG